MDSIGSAAFGSVIGWALCFGMGWKISILLTRLLWAMLFAIAALGDILPHILPLLVGALVGGLCHLALAHILLNHHDDTRETTS